MNEEIEYAEMLEIPVSTVNVVRKTRRRKKAAEAAVQSPVTPAPAELPLKDSVIAQVNDRLEETALSPELSQPSDPLADVEENRLDFDPIPDRIDTVRLYASEGKGSRKKNRLFPQEYELNAEKQNEGGMYEFKPEKHASKVTRITLGAEFAAACVLCGAIFFTNIFMPNSAINTFFRAMGGSSTEAAATDTRTYSDFELSPVVSELSDAELTLSDTGVLSFTDECCVYPAADGTVSEVTKTADGVYTVKISHSDSFTGVMQGLDYVYYEVGDEVKSNVPVGYSKGETEVQVTMYSSGELLNCFQLTDENCLAWVESTT